MRGLRRLTLVITTAVLVTAGLATMAHGAAPRAPRASSGGETTLRLPWDMASTEVEFDVQKIKVGSPQHQNLIYGTLLRKTPSGSVVPDLAKSVTVVDPSTIEVTLKDGLKFTDGTPVDAAAFKFSIDRTIAHGPTGGFETEVFQIDSVTVDAPLKFTVRLKTPIAGAVTRLMRLCEVGCPVSPTAVQKGTDFSTNPVGAGPYTLASVTPGQEFVLEKNPGYWDAKHIKIDRIQYKNVPAAAAVTALSGNQTDFAVLSRLQTQDLAGSPNVKTKSEPTDNQMLLGHMCKNRPPFDDLEVRQALNYATDRADFDEKLYGGQGEPMWGWFGQDSINAAPELDGIYETNLKKAKKLLADAGQSNLTFDLNFSPGSPDSETGAQIAQQQWAKAGITVNLKPLTTITDFLPNATSAPMLILPLQREGISKVSRILGPGSIGNVCNWDDPELNALIIEAQGLPDGSEELAKVWEKISTQTFEKTAADVFVVFGTSNYAWNTSTVAKIPVYDGRLGTPEVYFWGATMKAG